MSIGQTNVQKRIKLCPANADILFNFAPVGADGHYCWCPRTAVSSLGPTIGVGIGLIEQVFYSRYRSLPLQFLIIRHIVAIGPAVRSTGSRRNAPDHYIWQPYSPEGRSYDVYAKTAKVVITVLSHFYRQDDRHRVTGV